MRWPPRPRSWWAAVHECVPPSPTAASYTWDFKAEINSIFQDLEECRAAKARADGAASENVANACAALRRRSAPRSFREAAEASTDLAVALSSDRGRLCDAPGPEYEALARAMAEVARSVQPAQN